MPGFWTSLFHGWVMPVCKPPLFEDVVEYSLSSVEAPPKYSHLTLTCAGVSGVYGETAVANVVFHNHTNSSLWRCFDMSFPS
jgi:hypothetical protein